MGAVVTIVFKKVPQSVFARAAFGNAPKQVTEQAVQNQGAEDTQDAQGAENSPDAQDGNGDK